jgi:TctA family transporter
MILEAFAEALGNFADPGLLLFMTMGVITGLIFGIIPGIGSLLAMVLFLPFAFVLIPEHALPFMVAVSAVGYTGGSITAILLNIPGQATSAATLIDGYPMTQKGEGGRALGAALMSSGLGGSATVFIALAMVPLVLPMILAIVSADMVFIILLGLAFMGALTTGSRIKGLVSGGLGLLVAFIGVQTVTAGSRFTFGSDYLYAGIGLVPLLIGIFAIPEAIALAVEGGTIAKAGTVIKGMGDVWKGAKDTFRHWTIWLRSTIIGYIIGIIPGVGAMAATFIVYGQAKQTSKHPEKFGTGIVEGVIAPESANNAKEAGALLTTLALGIPGSAAMAILLGAFLMLGLIPGPEMMTEHLDLSLTLLLVIVAANLLGIAICFPAAPHLAKVAYMPSRILVPVVLVIALVGVFALRELFNDVIVTAIFSVLGIAMRRFGFNRPALVLGFVLGGPV